MYTIGHLTTNKQRAFTKTMFQYTMMKFFAILLGMASIGNIRAQTVEDSCKVIGKEGQTITIYNKTIKTNFPLIPAPLTPVLPCC